MSFDDITHWVQIPLSWYRAVNRLLHTHGGDCITYSPDAEDGPMIALDTRRVQELIEDQLDIGGGHPEDPTSYADLTTSGEGTAAAKTNNWTYNGTSGVKVTKQTRTYYDHTSSSPVLYGYYRTFLYDKNGRLYSVSAETRYEIDTPVVGNISTT